MRLRSLPRVTDLFTQQIVLDVRPVWHIVRTYPEAIVVGLGVFYASAST